MSRKTEKLETLSAALKASLKRSKQGDISLEKPKIAERFLRLAAFRTTKDIDAFDFLGDIEERAKKIFEPEVSFEIAKALSILRRRTSKTENEAKELLEKINNDLEDTIISQPGASAFAGYALFECARFKLKLGMFKSSTKHQKDFFSLVRAHNHLILAMECVTIAESLEFEKEYGRINRRRIEAGYRVKRKEGGKAAHKTKHALLEELVEKYVAYVASRPDEKENIAAFIRKIKSSKAEQAKYSSVSDRSILKHISKHQKAVVS